MAQKYRKALPWSTHPKLTPLREETPPPPPAQRCLGIMSSQASSAAHERENLEESALPGICEPPPKRTEWSSAGKAPGLDLSAAP